MRRHLVAVLIALPTAVAFVLGLPLAMHRIDRAGQDLVITRLAEAEELVSSAVAVLRSQAGGSDQLSSYRARTDVNVVVLDADGAMAFGSSCATQDRPWRQEESVRTALRGGHLESADYAVNDGRRELVVATPVIDGGRHWGAVVTCSSLAGLKTHAWTVWITTAVAAFLTIALSAVLAESLARWLLRPIGLFDRAARHFADGDYGARVSVDSGPTELRVLGEAFNRMAEQLQHTLQTQRSFVGDASHQLRNPLVALRLRLENLEPYVRPEGMARMDAALQEAARMSLIINALLTLARAEGRPQPLECVDATGVLADRAASWRLSAEAKKLRIELDCEPGGWTAALPGTLDQIVDVFMDNAIRASPPGGRIVLATVVTAETIKISCRDQGPGMTAEVAARACDRFWRGPQTRDTEGSGLGLSIAVSLAHASSGRILLQPGRTEGLDATAVLPAWQWWWSTSTSVTPDRDAARS